MNQHSHFLLETDIPYGKGGGRELHLDVLRQDGPAGPRRPAVIWVHGGGWRGGVRDPHPNAMLARRGFVTATIGYRFSQEAIFPAQIHDVKAAIRFLRANAERWGIDPDRIGIWGHSAGGHLAALAAVSGDLAALEGDGGGTGVSSRVQAAVPMSPATDFLVDWYADSGYPPHEAFSAVVELLGGRNLHDPEVRERARLASPYALAATGAAPMLIVHGWRDDLVPVSQGRRLAARLRELGIEASLIELAEIDHSQDAILGPEDGAMNSTRQAIVEFFVRTLGPVESL